MGHVVLLGVGHVGDLLASPDELAEDALVLDDAGVVLDVEGVGHYLGHGADVLLSARLGIDALLHQHIDESDHVDIPAGEEELVHGGEDLLVLLQIEVGYRHQIGDLVEGLGIHQHSAQKGLLGYEGEG